MKEAEYHLENIKEMIEDSKDLDGKIDRQHLGSSLAEYFNYGDEDMISLVEENNKLKNKKK